MTSTEEQLRASLRRHADDVATPGDVYDVVLRRCRRGRRRRVVAAVAGACALVLIAVPATTSLLHADRDRGGVAGPVQPYPLPPRGPLAADDAFLAAVVQVPWGRGPDALRPAPGSQQVVYAGDAGGQRWAFVVGAVDGQLTGVWLAGPAGAAGDSLTLREEPHPIRPDPEVYSYYAEGTEVLFVIGSLGDHVAVSERPDIDATGTVSREYHPVDAVDGVAVLVYDQWRPALLVRVDRGSTTICQGCGIGSASFSPEDQPQTWTDQQISVAAESALGTPPDPDVARQVLESLTGYAGYDIDELDLSVLWAGPVGDPSRSDTQGLFISARLPSGALAVLGGHGEYDAEGNLTASGIDLFQLYPAGTSAQDLLLVMRSNFYDGSGPTPVAQELTILGPVGSASFTVSGLAATDEQSPDGRILRVHPGADVTGVQARDAAGTVLAEEPVGDVQDVGAP